MQASINRQSTRIPVFTLMVNVCVWVLCPFVSVGHANEIWVPPATEPANKTKGNWADAEFGDKKKTHFGFHVPDNFQVFTERGLALLSDQRATRNNTMMKKGAGSCAVR
ncbi:MAG: hypothetical protein IH978_10110 [Nitrospinae bacterium]|nr:hypothetical protein [Nitrospinota bacterium]